MTYADGSTRRTDYDALGRRIRDLDPRGGSTQYQYDAVGNVTAVTDPTGATTRYEYGANARVTRVIDALGRTTQFAYDANGRPIRTTYPTGETRDLEYNQLGQIIRDINGGRTVEFTYDARPRVVEIADASASGIVLAQWRYDYDLAGNRVRIIALDGSRIVYEYDAAQRVVAERSFDAAALPTGQTTYSYNAAGDLISRTGTLGNATFLYSSAGQLLSGEGKTYTYDATGNVATITDALGQVTTLAFDARGRLIRMQRTGDPASVYEYDAQGNRVAATVGSARTDDWIDRQPGELARVLRAERGMDTVQYIHQGFVEQEIVNGVTAFVHRDALDTVTTRIGEVAQYVGGAMAAVAVFYFPQSVNAAVYTFGPKFLKGMMNTFEIARDMLGGANASYEISFGLNTATGKTAVAYYNRGVSEAQHNLGNRRFARFGLAPTFAFLGLGGAIRPMIPIGGLFGEPSMGGIMVHEFSHFSLDTKDAAYLCQNVAYARPIRGLASGVFTTDESLKNADNYRCYARAVTLAFERLAAEIL